MKILVTGATGFIGRYVIEELLRTNHEIIATSRDIEKAKKFEWFSKVEYIPYDVKKEEGNLFEFFQKPDMLIHLSWEGLPHHNELFHVETNLMKNYSFIKNLVEGGLKKVVVTGTCAEYGTKEGKLKENQPVVPQNSYALAKDCLRKFLELLKQKEKFDLKWIRIFYAHGEGQQERSLVQQLIKAIKNKKSCFEIFGWKKERDFIEIQKVAEYIVKISLQPEISGIFNCGSGKAISIEKFTNQYIKKLGANIKLKLKNPPYSKNEPRSAWADTIKLKQALKYFKKESD